jgi:GNAT superfamily N-acetyltransferase
MPTTDTSHDAVRRLIRTVLAASCACQPRDLLDTGVTFVEARPVAGRMRFPMPAKPLAIVTMGAGVVVSAHAERLPWLRATLATLERDAIFSARTIGALSRFVGRDGQELLGPALKYACAPGDLRLVTTPDGITIELVAADRIARLYRYAGFGNALSYPQGRTENPRPDMVAAVATHAGTVVGIAGASADAEELWQIGIDVQEPMRGRGIGRALVGRLTRAVLDAGKIPYYTTAAANIGSRAIAASLGYWPAWTEMYARDQRVGMPE